MGSTPRFQIPYAEPNDPLTEGADAMRAQATRVDNLLDHRVEMNGGLLWGSWNPAMPVRQVIYRAQGTTNEFGQIFVTPSNWFGQCVAYASLDIVSNTVNWGITAQIDLRSTPHGGNVIFVVLLPDGNQAANRWIDHLGLLIGQ